MIYLFVTVYLYCDLVLCAPLKKFIKQLNPRQAVVVHCARPYRDSDITLEQEIIADGECRTQFIFAQENEIYKL